MSERRPVLVVGGGFSGIAVAERLRGAGQTPILIDRGERLGGRSAGARLGEQTVTLGGKNIGRRYRRFRAFAASFGVTDWEPFGINTTRVDAGAVRTLDSERRLAGYLRFARGLGGRDLWRFARLCAAVRCDEEKRFLDTAKPIGGSTAGTATLASSFSPTFCRRIVRPITVRMNGAEPDETYLANFGANLGMLLDTFDQPSGGMQPLLDRFAAGLTIRQGTRVESLISEGGTIRGVRVRRRDGRSEDLHGSAVVLAIPADAAAQLVEPHSPALARALREVRYFPAAVVIAAYPQPVFSAERRAFLFDAEHPLSNAGAYSARRRQIVRYTFSGRTARALLEEGIGPEELLTVGERLLAPHTPDPLRQASAIVAAQWKSAYCAYAADQGALLQACAAPPPGLHLTGDYLAGASIEACFRAGQSCADRLLAERGAQTAETAVHA